MQVRFLGPLGVVTGSCTWMRDTARDWSFLVDCGIQQGEPTQDLWNEANWPFDPKEIKFVILTHAHMDHSGLIPALYRKGFEGPVFCTRETQKLAVELLKDGILHSELPYAPADIERVIWREPGTDQPFGNYLPVDNDLFLQFFRTGHIVGAVSVVVSWGPKGPDQRSIHFSGDIGPGAEDRETLPLLRFRMAPSMTSHYAVVESTYGAVVRTPERQDAQKRRVALQQLLDCTLEQNGALVLPAFSIARTQDLMFDLHWVVADGNGKYDRMKFVLDSPLARRVHPVILEALNRTERTYKGKVRPRWLGKQFFRDLGLDDKNPLDIAEGQAVLRMVFDPAHNNASQVIAAGNRIARNWRPIFGSAKEARQARNAEPSGPTVVVSSSGTCDGGPVVQWLSRLLTLDTTTIAMMGHCSPSSVGGKLLSIGHVPLNERVRDTGSLALSDKDSIKVSKIRARICKVEGYSAHADQSDLLNWLVWEREDICNLAAREVFIQHGEDRHRQSLASALSERARARRLVVRTHLPNDAGQWWSLEQTSSTNVVDLDAERARLEKEILELRSRLNAMG